MTEKRAAQRMKILARRQRVFKLVGQGLTGKEIAEQLGITERTYDFDIAALKERLSNSARASEELVKTISRREEHYRDLKLLSKNADNSRAKINAIKNMNETQSEIDKINTRLGLLPRESVKVELEGGLTNTIKHVGMEELLRRVAEAEKMEEEHDKEHGQKAIEQGASRDGLREEPGQGNAEGSQHG